MDKNHSIEVYADTSVFGGVFDEKFSVASLSFFEQVKSGRFRLVSSVVVRDKIGGAPTAVREFYARVIPAIDVREIPEEAIGLQTAYLDARIVGRNSLADALHVAIATAMECRMIVSWNFKHIVHFQKIPLYNGVNKSRGFAEIAIYSPLEVLDYGQEV